MIVLPRPDDVVPNVIRLILNLSDAEAFDDFLIIPETVNVRDPFAGRM